MDREFEEMRMAELEVRTAEKAAAKEAANAKELEGQYPEL